MAKLQGFKMFFVNSVLHVNVSVPDSLNDVSKLLLHCIK